MKKKSIKCAVVSVEFHQSRNSQIGHGWNEVILSCGHWFPCKASRKIGKAAICRECTMKSDQPVQLPEILT